MEVIAAVGAGVKGCVTLFNICVGLYDLIDRGSSYGKDYTHLMTKLDVEKFRLLAWGEALRIVGLDPNAEDLSESEVTRSINQPTWGLIERVLCCMKEVFDDTKELNKRYGLKQANSESLQIGQSTLSLSLTSTRPFTATFQRFQARIKKTQKDASFIAKTRWVVSDLNKSTKLIEKLHGWNDDLDNILKSLKRTELQQRILEHEFGMMENADDIYAIEEVAAEDNPTISDAASSRLRLLQAAMTPDEVDPLIGTASSFSDGSFWTAPSQTLSSLIGQLGLRDRADQEHVPVDTTPQNRRLFSAQAPPLEEFTQGSANAGLYGQVLKPFQIEDIAKCCGAPRNYSQRLLKELKDFAKNPQADFISWAPIHDNLVCHSKMFLRF
jgi:Prion-inhibition and propagation